MTKIVSEKVLMTKELSFVKRSIGRLFLSMLILFLSISNVAVPVYGETVTTEESYTETSYNNTNTKVTYKTNNFPTDVQHVGSGTSPDPSTWVPQMTTGEGGYPISVEANYQGEKISMYLSPIKGYYKARIVNPDTGEVYHHSSSQIINDNLKTGATLREDSKNVYNAQTIRSGEHGHTTYHRIKNNSKYHLEVKCNNVTKGTFSAKYQITRPRYDYTSTTTETTDKWDINLTIRMYMDEDGGGQVDLFKETRTITYYHDLSAFKESDSANMKKVLYPATQTVPRENTSTTITSTIPFSVVNNYVAASTDYHAPNPSEASSNTLIKTVDDEADWTEGISATWGKTTANVIRPDSTATTDGGGDGMGTITDTSLSEGTDADLSTDGSTFDRIGVKEHEYLIKDAHSLSSEAQYSGDNTSATVKRNIIVKTEAKPSLTAYYEGTEDEYQGEWLSQYAPTNTTEGPDADRFKKVDLKASGSGIAGTYDTVIWEKGASEGSDSEAARGTNKNNVAHTYGAETGADGTSFYANLQETNKGTAAKNAGLTALSGNTDNVTVKIDSTPPTANVSVSDDWHEGLTFADSSSDALSGIDKVYIALVAPDSTAPTIGDSSWQELGSSGTVDYTPGEKYDIYAYAVDNATNKSPVKLLESGRGTIRRHHTVSYESNGGSPVASEQVYEGEKATEPTAPTRTDYHFVGWYQEEGLTNPFNFDTPIMQETKLYAKWVDDRNHNGKDDNTEFRTITYTDGVDDEEVFADVVYANALDGLATPAFDPADPDKEPTRRYFVFDGWTPQVAGVVNGDATYTARWERDKNDNGIADEDEPYEYFYSEGDGNVWQKGSGLSSNFTVKRSLFDEDTIAHFINGGHGIQVDGVTVDASDYTATEGSVKLSLKPAYLETLSVGEHKLTTLFDDGEATAAFYVKTKNEDLGGPGSGDDSGTVPGSGSDGNSSNGQDDAKGGKTARGSSARTGDESVLYGWLAAMLIASIAAAGILYRRRNNKH